MNTKLYINGSKYHSAKILAAISKHLGHIPGIKVVNHTPDDTRGVITVEHNQHILDDRAHIDLFNELKTPLDIPYGRNLVVNMAFIGGDCLAWCWDVSQLTGSTK